MSSKEYSRAVFVIMGGGIIGSAAAFFLARRGLAADTIVIEPDPTYEFAATPAGAGGVRRLMSRSGNIQMSQFSLDFYADMSAELEMDVDIGFKRQGYLFLVDAAGVAELELNFKTQQSLGVDASLLDLDALQRVFPSVGTDQVAMACHSPNDAWIDPQAAMLALRHKAEQLGVQYIRERVIGLECSGNSVKSAILQSASRVEADHFINTAGAWAAEIAAMTDDRLPVVPMCRVQHYWLAENEIEPLPLVKDGTGSFFRPEGAGFVGGRPSFEIEPGFIRDIDQGYFADYFERSVWPLLADMVPKFESIKLQRQWGGHYAQNQFDGNMILGRYSRQYENIITACGFSGHGIMHAPAVGRAISELCVDREFRTLDLSAFGFQRVIDNRPYAEIGIR